MKDIIAGLIIGMTNETFKSIFIECLIWGFSGWAYELILGRKKDFEAKLSLYRPDRLNRLNFFFFITEFGTSAVSSILIASITYFIKSIL